MDGILGFTVLFAGNFAPKGWAFCDGSLLQIRSNTALFSVIGTTYGGDGTVTFALPDLRGRAVIGSSADHDMGDLGGFELIPGLTERTTPPHTHPFSVKIKPQGGGIANSASPQSAVYAISANDLYNYSTDAFLAPYNALINTSAAGSAQPQPLMMMHPVLVLNWVICTQGVFPGSTDRK